MNVFDIIGPVMVGPSSSHTAGAVKIGIIARAVLGEPPENVVISLHGSFALTYKGHGTDKAILAGLLGMSVDDVRIRDSLDIAQKAGLSYRFETIALRDAHPNTAVITATGKNGKKISVQGASIGGGNIVIQKLNGMNVEFTGQYDTLVISHIDTPGVVSEVTHLLSCDNINIANMKVFRSRRGGDAVMVIETDQGIGPDLLLSFQKISRINNVIRINAV